MDKVNEKRLHELINKAGPLAANEVISSFIHRLNNFLFIVSGRIEMCGDSPSDKEATMATIRIQIDKLKESISKYEKIKDVCGPIKTTCFIGQLTSEVIGNFRKIIAAEKRKKLTFIPLEEDCQIVADPPQIAYAIYHLIDNALEATPPGDETLVKLSEEGGKVILRVENPLFSDSERFSNEMKEIFFTTKDNRAGLSLGIVKRITRFHDYECRFESEERKNIVTITMPTGK